MVVIGTYWGEWRPEAVPPRRVRKPLLPPVPLTNNAAVSLPRNYVHIFEIHELPKPHPVLEHRRRFELDLGDGVCGRRALVVRHRYVVFARRLRQRWIPASGQDGGSMSIYDVSGADAMSLEEGQFPPALPTRTFIEELRK